jgi:hypothetical protein
VTPLGVVAHALHNEMDARGVLERLRAIARAGLQPGETGVVVFPAEGMPYFDAGVVVVDPRTSGNGADAHYPPMEVRDLDQAERSTGG